MLLKSYETPAQSWCNNRLTGHR